MRKIEKEMLSAVNEYNYAKERSYIFLGNTVVYKGLYTCPLYVTSTLYNNLSDKVIATVTLFNNVIAYVTEDYLYFTTYFTSTTTKSRLNALITGLTDSSISFCSEGELPVLRNFSTDFDCIPYGKADTKQVTRNKEPALIIPGYIQWVRLPRKGTEQVILYK